MDADINKLNKLNNKGFSLLELIVSFAILTFVIAAIVGLMATGMRFFRNTTSSVGLQYEYQVVMTHIREFAVDCNAGIAYDASQEALYIINTEIVPDPDPLNPLTSDEIYYAIHVFVFDNPVLNYKVERVQDDGTPGFLPASIDLTAGMSEVSRRMNNFIVDIVADIEPEIPPVTDPVTGLITKPGIPKKIIRVSAVADMGFFNNSRQYDAQQTIAMRNRVESADSYTALRALLIP